jgi:hypothetical protein
MTTTLTERIEAIEREMQQQDEAWQQTREGLARLGQVELAVPRDALSFIVGPIPPPPAGAVRA